MLVREARAVATAWVGEHEAEAPWFHGAFFTGSATARDPVGELPASSDVDIIVVTAEDRPTARKLGKFSHRGVLLEVTHLPRQKLTEAEQVAATYYLAPSFTGDHIIADPTGHLAMLCEYIAPRFPSAEAITRRCEDVMTRIDTKLATVNFAAPWHEQVTGWLFPTSLTTQVPVVATLRPPTVRLRYLAARQVLHEYGHPHLYRQMLELTGCADVTAAVVQHHLDGLAGIFDQAAALARTRFLYSADITAAARPVAIDGSQELLDRGDHREAVFWIIATLARCQQVLDADAPEQVARAAAERFTSATADLLGVRDPGDLSDRARLLQQFMSELGATAEALTRQAGPQYCAAPLDGRRWAAGAKFRAVPVRLALGAGPDGADRWPPPRAQVGGVEP